jgi:tellurite resistance protein
MAAIHDDLLSRVVASIASAGEPTPSGRMQRSILSQSAASFARRPSGAESTIPTGFDPRAASLFEAVVEAAFLVANADGEFDPTERATFEQVVSQACHNTVQQGDVHSLVSDLCDQLDEDGVDRRIQMIASVIADDHHKLEVLRIAALMAFVSGGVADTERHVLDKLASGFGMPAGSVEAALDRAQRALAH